MPRTRQKMIDETRAKLIAVARKAFAKHGYADANMDEFTAKAGLTRGALYHHFGGKPGLLAAVIEQLDAEMNARLQATARKAPTRWQAFLDENLGYIEMALDPEIQRIVLRDGPAILGDLSTWPSANACVRSITASIVALQEEGTITSDIDAEATARLISGATAYAAQWIASSDDPETTSKRALTAVRHMLEGLRRT